MTDLTKIDQRFGNLPRATQMALFEARLEGEVIEHHSHGVRWLGVHDPVWASCAIYRVRPTPITYDSINWDHVAPRFIAMARSAGSGGFIFVNIPTAVADYWGTKRGDTINANVFASYTRGTCDWRDSLVLRPKGETK